MIGEQRAVSSREDIVSREQKAASSKKPHRNLMAWQTAMDLAFAVYEITKSFPKEEVYALSSQLRRAAVSVPSNIAEGTADRTTQNSLIFCPTQSAH